MNLFDVLFGESTGATIDAAQIDQYPTELIRRSLLAQSNYVKQESVADLAFRFDKFKRDLQIALNRS